MSVPSKLCRRTKKANIFWKYEKKSVTLQAEPENPEDPDNPEDSKRPESPEPPEKTKKNSTMPTPILQRHSDGTASVLRKAVVYTELRFYQRAEILYQLTVAFCEHFLPKYGDRTVDQMVQAARSTSSNIAEGSSDGQTSVETELKLLGIARGSNLELLNDYTRYLDHHHYVEWHGTNPRFEPLYQFCKGHLNISDYQPYFDKWKDEEFANCAICLCHMVDKGMTSYIAQKDREFVEQGGIRERMTAARMDYRNNTKKELDALRAENTALKAEVAALKAEVAALNAAPTGKSGRPG